MCACVPGVCVCVCPSNVTSLYACVVVERWLEKVKNVGVGICVLCKLDHQLHRKSTNKASCELLRECQFALLATTCRAAEEAGKAYQTTACELGLAVNIQKTKFLVAGSNVSVADRQGIKVEGGTIEHVEDFQYLGSVISESGTMDAEIDRRVCS